MSKSHKLPAATVKRREDPFALYEDELRTHFPSKEEILREAKLQTQARKKIVQRSIKAALALAFIGVVAIDPAWDARTLSTEIGQQASHQLADGSTVVLNTNTIIKEEKHIRSRRIELIQGEAGFTVKHEIRPFSVIAQHVMIKDIGTIFNVRQKQDRVRVSVIEGAVEVSVDGQQQVLNTAQAIEVHLGNLGPIDLVNPDNEAAWQRGRLVFDDAPLEKVASEIQRYTTQRITVARNAESIRLSGVYDVAEIDSFINDLPLSIPVLIERSNDGAVLIKKK